METSLNSYLGSLSTLTGLTYLSTLVEDAVEKGLFSIIVESKYLGSTVDQINSSVASISALGYTVTTRYSDGNTSFSNYTISWANVILPSPTPSITPTISITPSKTPSITPSFTPSISPSITPSNTPSITPSLSITPTMTPTPSYSTSSGFTTEWTVSDDKSITLPLTDNGTYSAVVNWGDGTNSTITAYDDPNRIHVYGDAGTYNVEITGECPGWSFDPFMGDFLKLTDIIYWGDSSKFGGFAYLTNGFSQCQNLKSTGGGKILSKTSLTDLSYLFNNCTSLTTINTGLFDNCTNVLSFVNTFNACTSLPTIPTNLFKYNTEVTTFENTFGACVNLQLNSNIFFGIGEESTRFASLTGSCDFSNCFYRNSFTGTQGSAPNLWDCTFGNGYVSYFCFSGDGNSLSSLDNYASIPSSWINPV